MKKEELRISQKEQPPLCSHCAAPMEDIIRIHSSPGTTRMLGGNVLRGKLVSRADVELVPEGTLPRFEMKAKLIRKLYEGE